VTLEAIKHTEAEVLRILTQATNMNI